tara:strand:+ start:4270 stop:4509 length:240 start_codon:yes stop_codon:yes gene_type:complete
MNYDQTMPLYKMPLTFKGFKFDECTNELLQCEFREMLRVLQSKNCYIKELKKENEKLKEEIMSLSLEFDEYRNKEQNED